MPGKARVIIPDCLHHIIQQTGRRWLADKLPDKVLKLVDLNSLEISKDSFIEKELADYYSGQDMAFVYQAAQGGNL
jgi:hypothetical protein